MKATFKNHADCIWCVERWYAGTGSDASSGYIKLSFPDSGNLSALEFYADLQRKVSSGQVPVPMQYLDPISVAVTFARGEIGHDFADASYFTEADGLPDGSFVY